MTIKFINYVDWIKRTTEVSFGEGKNTHNTFQKANGSLFGIFMSFVSGSSKKKLRRKKFGLSHRRTGSGWVVLNVFWRRDLFDWHLIGGKERLANSQLVIKSTGLLSPSSLPWVEDVVSDSGKPVYMPKKVRRLMLLSSTINVLFIRLRFLIESRVAETFFYDEAFPLADRVSSDQQHFHSPRVDLIKKKKAFKNPREEKWIKKSKSHRNWLRSFFFIFLSRGESSNSRRFWHAITLPNDLTPNRGAL